MRIIHTLYVTLLLCAGAHNAYATDPYEDKLLGDWNGVRHQMANAGIEPAIVYKADWMSNVSGGIDRGGNYLDNLDIQFALDGEKLLGIKGSKAFVYFINNNGAAFNSKHVGSTQAVDNIEVATTTFKLYEAWIEQSFWNEKLSVLLGLHDLNSEFYITDMTANFLKPVMQIGQDLAQTGFNGPAIFPTTSLAGRVRVQPTEESYISFAAFDGTPGALNDPNGTHIHARGRDGLLLIAEAGITPKVEGDDSAPNKFAVGAWTYSKRMDDLIDVDVNGDPTKHHSNGIYALSSYRFYQDQDSRSIGTFLRVGLSDSDTSQVSWAYETGLVGNGWIPGRKDGEIGLGMAQAHNGKDYMQSVITSGATSDHNEYSFELYYRDKLYRGITIQPDLQYVINPGMAPNVDNATIVGARLILDF